MSKKRRAASPPAKPASPTLAPVVRPRLAGWRGWVARAAVAVVIPALFLIVVELALRLAGFGYSTRFFVETDDGRAFTTNRKFGWQFMPRETATQPYPVSLPATKSNGVFRIFILGESAAQGTPAPGFGFARILEVMLQQQFPGQRFEIINAAMRGINSHAVRPIARECAAYEPDLFVIYMGNNEAVGFYAPEPGPFNLAEHLRLIRFVQWLKATKLAQLFDRATRALRKENAPKREKQDMEFFRKRFFAADDPLRLAVVDNFRANLADIVQATRGSGAKVILSTVAVNLLDFPPLASVHRAGLTPDELSRWDAAYQKGIEAEAKSDWPGAIQLYRQAAQIDDHFAALHYRLARRLLADGDFDAARRHFSLARDWDALQFRTDSRINGVIRELAVKSKDAGLHFTDAEQALAASSTNEHQIPGNQLFHEHVHFNFDGDYLTARTLLPAVVSALGLASGAGLTNAPPRPIPSRQECAAALGFSSWDEIGTKAAMVRLTANPPFLDQLEHGQRQARAEGEIAERTRAFQDTALQQQAIEVYRAALARRPDDWQIHLAFGNLLIDFGQFAEAANQFAVVVRAQPDFLSARMLFGHALRQAGRPGEAVAQFEEVLLREPNHPAVKATIADTIKSARTRP